MKRITVEEVLAAYKATGLKPMRREMFDGPDACAMKACAKAAGDGDVHRWVEKQGIDQSYMYGFWDGFDDADRKKSWNIFESREYDLGKEDGQAAAAAVFAELEQPMGAK